MNSNEEQRLINSINKLSRKVMFDKFDIFRRQSELYVLLLQNTGLSGKNIHMLKIDLKNECFVDIASYINYMRIP